MKHGLVLEGGAMRGLFSAGVFDVMLAHGIEFDGIVGVSAGAAFGCNYKSRQIGRSVRYNKLMAHDKRYCSLRSLIKTGNLFNAAFAYHYVPMHIDLFDCDTFAANPTEFHLVCTDVETGGAMYKRLDMVDNDALEWIRTSASMPLFSRVVELEGHKLLDGGVADSIPLQYAERQGWERNIVILTRPSGYRKRPNRLMSLIHMALHRYPNMVEAIRRRHIMYNNQLEYVAQAEKEGRAFIIRPPYPLPIRHICHDPEKMQQVYDIGQQTGRQMLKDIEEFLNKQ